MTVFLLRVALPDRPGALGAVASRIGAVRADVVALDIVGRGEGRAVDEFVVELADDSHVSLLLSEVAEVDGVEVEELRILPDLVGNRRYDAYDTAAALLAERQPQRVLQVVAQRAAAELQPAWSAVLDLEQRSIVAASGSPPAGSWIAAYVEGSRWHRPEPLAPANDSGPTQTPTHRPARDAAWVALQAWDLVLAVGRPGWVFGEHDRRRLGALARLADARWADLVDDDSRRSHPSHAG